MGVHFVTGAGSGIGAAVAAVFAERGEELWLLARDEARAAELRDRFPASRTLVADLSAPASIRARLAAVALPERLDSLVHVAGVVESGRVEELDAALWQDTLAVNLVAPAALTGVLLPALRAGGGHVVFVNSGAGVHAPPRLSAYAASKFGLKALAESLRAEEYAHGVRVTTVYPGETDTPMQVKLHEQFGLPYEPRAHMRAASVAAALVMALDLPQDATMSEVMLRPGC